jgi:hypothetical protein
LLDHRDHPAEPAPPPAAVGIVIHGELDAVARAFAEAGWLERRFQGDGEMSWWWTRQPKPRST